MCVVYNMIYESYDVEGALVWGVVVYLGMEKV